MNMAGSHVLVFVDHISTWIDGGEFVIPIPIRHNIASAVSVVILAINIGLPNLDFGVGNTSPAVVLVHVTVNGQGVVIVALGVPRTILGQSVGSGLIVRAVNIGGCRPALPWPPREENLQ